MAPTKRNSKASPEPGPKKLKTDPLIAGVIDGIRQAEGLDERCRAMLVAGLPSCFRTDGNDQRHELQVALEDWVKQVLQKVQDGMEEAVETMDNQVADAQNQRGTLDGKVAEAEEAFTKSEEATKARNTAVTEASKGVEGAKANLSAAHEGRGKGESDLAKAREEKQKMCTMTEHLHPLKDASKFEASEADAHLAVLSPCAKELGLDESLCAALPTVCRTPPGERTGFMRTVFGQFEAALAARAAELGGAVEASEVAAEDCAAAVADRERELRSAEAALEAAREELAGAQARQREAAAMVSAAKAGLAAFDADLEASMTAREEKVFSLENFQGYNMACFNMLKEQATAAAAPTAGAAPVEA